MTDMKGCSKSSGTVNLSRGSFVRQQHMKSLASSDIVIVLLNFISSSIYIILSHTIFIKSRSDMISNGTRPNNNSYVRMPILQTSILLL